MTDIPGDLFTRKFVTPKTYFVLFNGLFGEGWPEWEPETIWSEILDRTKKPPTEEVKNKINALKLLVSRNSFFADFQAFEKTILSFNDRFIDPYVIQVCVPEELAYGLTAAGQVRQHPFAAEISHYIRGCCDQDGLVVYHKAFKFAQPKYEDEFRRGIAEQVAKLWDDDKFRPITLTDKDQNDPVMLQVGRLHDIEVYVRERLAKENQP